MKTAKLLLVAVLMLSQVALAQTSVAPLRAARHQVYSWLASE
jgi:hypothetical protein